MIEQLKDLALRFMHNPKASERFGICTSCPKFNSQTNHCTVCGCLMTIKTFIPIARCPENKW